MARLDGVELETYAGDNPVPARAALAANPLRRGRVGQLPDYQAATEAFRIFGLELSDRLTPAMQRAEEQLQQMLRENTDESLGAHDTGRRMARNRRRNMDDQDDQDDHEEPIFAAADPRPELFSFSFVSRIDPDMLRRQAVRQNPVGVPGDERVLNDQSSPDTAADLSEIDRVIEGVIGENTPDDNGSEVSVDGTVIGTATDVEVGIETDQDAPDVAHRDNYDRDLAMRWRTDGEPVCSCNACEEVREQYRQRRLEAGS